MAPSLFGGRKGEGVRECNLLQVDRYAASAGSCMAAICSRSSRMRASQ
jgi:hypothetical protein